jgi:hypothetical protein
MSCGMALKIAMDLLHVPSTVRLYRSGPLPDGVQTLLRIVTDDTEVRAAAALADQPPEIIRRAAVFFIEQILFAPDADSYQVLGASPHASAAELRGNMGLLLRWLHPDRGSGGERSVFTGRVTAAWNDLKTPERRAAYEARRNAKASGRSHRKMARERWWHGNMKPTAAVAPYQRSDGAAARSTYGFWRRALSILFQTQR